MQSSTATLGKQAVLGHQAPFGWNAMETRKGLLGPKRSWAQRANWRSGDSRDNLENSSLRLFFFIAIIVEQIVVGFVSIIVLLIGSSPVDAHLYYGM